MICSSPARGREREIAPHPSLKPQHFLRQLVRAALPLGEGVILDPFMGSGSTTAAASACGLRSIGLEINTEYFNMAKQAIPLLVQYLPGAENGVGAPRSPNVRSRFSARRLAAGGDLPDVVILPSCPISTEPRPPSP